MKASASQLSVVLAGVLVAPAALAQNGAIAVNADSALVGSFGLEVTANQPGGNAAFVQTNTPAQETGVKIDFYVKPSTDGNDTPLDLAPGSNVRVAKVLTKGGVDTPPNASSLEHIVVLIKRNLNDTNWRIRVMAQQNFGFFATCAETFLTGGAGPAKKISIEWVQGTGAQGSQDGRCSVYVDDVLKGQRTDLNTSDFNVNQFRLGTFQGNDAGITGTYFVDEVTLTRI